MQIQFLRSVGRVLALVVALSVVSSCSEKEAAKTGPSSGTKLEELREDAVDLQGEAKAAGADKYAQESFEKGQRLLAEADDLLDATPDKIGKIRNKLTQARSNFKKSMSRSKKNKKEFDRTKQLEKEFTDVVAKLDEAKDPFRTLDPDGWELAREKFDEAKELLEDGKPRDARTRLASALSDLKNTIAVAGRVQASQQRALRARDKMGLVKARALELKARQHAEADLAYAEEQERLAIRKLADSDFSLAENYFRNAESIYQQALTTAQVKLASANAKDASDLSRSEGDAHNDATSDNEPAPEVSEVDPPPNDDESHEIDLDVASAIAASLHGSPDFHGDMLSLEYLAGGGSELQKDLQVLQGVVGEHVLFKGIAGVGVDEYLMGGNTKGYVVLKPVFKDRVRLEIEFQSQLNVGAAPTFQLLLMATGPRDFYGSHFGTNILISNDGKGLNQVPSANREFHQHVNKWLQRREPVRMRFEYRKKGESKGILRVYFKGEEICRKETDFYRTGRVGLRWSNAKWYIKELSVTGQIDEAWAASFK